MKKEMKFLFIFVFVFILNFVSAIDNFNISSTTGNLFFVNGTSGYVGIGTGVPVAKLDIKISNGGLAVIGSNTASGNQSIALGVSSTASGWGSLSTGFSTTAGGTGSLAGGVSSSATGDYSLAIGRSAIASGWASQAFGAFTNSAGNSSFASGHRTNASASYSTAMGSYTTASGSYSTAIGSSTTASALASTAIGSSTTASGTASTSMGGYTIASNQFSTAMGFYTIASGGYSTAIGTRINVSGSNSLGIGLNTTRYNLSQANAMAIMGGKVGIGTTSPNQTLSVVGSKSIGASVPSTMTGVFGGVLATVDGNNVLYMQVASSGYGELSTYNYTGSSTFPLALNANGGNVGIGDSTPSYPLDVTGEIRSTSNIITNDKLITSRYGSAGTYDSAQVQGIWSIGDAYQINTSADSFGNLYGMGYSYNQNGGAPFASEHQIVFTNAGTINAAIGLGGSAYFKGKVGIGTTSPAEQLTVNGNISTSDGTFYSDSTSTSSTSWINWFTPELGEVGLISVSHGVIGALYLYVRPIGGTNFNVYYIDGVADSTVQKEFSGTNVRIKTYISGTTYFNKIRLI